MTLPASSIVQMIDVDRVMIEEYHIPLLQMMENAGRNLAEQARRMLGDLNARRIVVLCGAASAQSHRACACKVGRQPGSTRPILVLDAPSGLEASTGVAGVPISKSV